MPYRSLPKKITLLGLLFLAGCVPFPLPATAIPPTTIGPKTLPATWTPRPSTTWTPTWTPTATLTTTKTSTLTLTATRETPAARESSPSATPVPQIQIPTRTPAPQESSSGWLISLPEMRFISMTETGDNGALLLAEMQSESGDFQNVLIRLTPVGEIAWSKLLRPMKRGALEVEDGGMVVYDEYSLVKLDQEGSFSWYEKTEDAAGEAYFILPRINAVKRMENGDRLVQGRSSYTVFAPDGQVLDHRGIRVPYVEDTSASWLGDAAYWRAGQIEFSGFWVARSGLEGDSWQRRFNFDKFGSDIHSLDQVVLSTEDGGGFFAATVRYLRSMAPHVGIWAARFDQQGGIRWQYAIDGGIEEDLLVQETSEGGFLLTTASGYMIDLPSSMLRLVRLNAEGEQIWDRWYGDGESYLSPREIIQFADGGFLVAAAISDSTEEAYYQQLLLLRTDRDGLIENCSWMAESLLDPPIVMEPDGELTGWAAAEITENEAATTRLSEHSIDVLEGDISAEVHCP